MATPLSPIDQNPPEQEKRISLALVTIVPFLFILFSGSTIQNLCKKIGTSVGFGHFLGQVFAIAIPTLWLLYHYRIKISETMAIHKCRKSLIPGIAAFFIGILVIVDAYTNHIVRVLGSGLTSKYVERFEKFVQYDSATGLFWMLVSLVIMPAVFEELLFRGIILRACLQRMGVGKASILVGIFFAFIHFDPIAFPGHIILGISWAYITAKTGTLVYAIVIHAANNAIFISTFQEALHLPIPIWIELTVGVLAMILGLVLLWKAGFQFGEKKEKPTIPPPAQAPG